MAKRKITQTYNSHFYTALIYILHYNSGIAGWSPGVNPPELSKVLLESCKSDEKLFGVEVGVFSDQTLCHPWHRLAVIGIHCLFYHQLLGASPQTPTKALPLGDFHPRPLTQTS